MQQNIPLVTVGIPSYNRPAGLQNTLQCILTQTYKNLEVIVSDNCSEDTSVLQVLQKYAASDARLRFVIQPKNQSIIPNFQFLLKQAKGDYFMWAADDDSWDPDFIETCVAAMQHKPEVILCMTDVKLNFENGTSRYARLNRSFMQKNLYARSFSFVKSTAENKYFFCGLYRTSLIQQIMFDNNWGSDHLFLYEALTRGKFLYIPGVSCFYYFRGGSSADIKSVRKAFNITNRFYFFDRYILRFTTYQFRFKHLNLLQKTCLFFVNWVALLFNEDFILYYIFIKKPIKALIGYLKKRKD